MVLGATVAGRFQMSDAVNDAELGRSKQSASPREHLMHLLKIGWDTKSPLIRRYVTANGLERVLADWVEKNPAPKKSG